jgi:hypothetical protein
LRIEGIGFHDYKSFLAEAEANRHNESCMSQISAFS